MKTIVLSATVAGDADVAAVEALLRTALRRPVDASPHVHFSFAVREPTEPERLDFLGCPRQSTHTSED